MWRSIRSAQSLAAVSAVLVLSLGGLALTVAMQRSYVGPRVASTLTPGGGALSVHLTAGHQALRLNLVAGAMVPPRSVHVLVDPAYPTLVTNFRDVKGLYDHLAIDLPEGGYGAPVRRVDSAGLAQAMHSDPRGIMVVGSGALPDTVVGPRHDFAPVKTFLEGGGELIYAGDGLLYWSSRKGMQSFSLKDAKARVDWAGERTVLGYDLVHDPAGDPHGQTLATVLSPIAQALAISHQLAPRGARLSELAAHHGWDVGRDTVGSGDPRTSVAVVPVGAGHLVLFGSGLYGQERTISNDIARLILSGSDLAPPLGSLSTVLDENSDQTVVLPLVTPVGAAAVRLLAYDAGGFAYFHRSVVVPGGPGPSPATSATPSPSAGESPTPSAALSPSPFASPSPTDSPSPIASPSPSASP